MKQPDSPIKHKRKPESLIWYCNSPLVTNAIMKFLVNAGVPENINKHYVKKSCISRLMDADIPENYVAQLSSHKNLKV